MQADILEDNKEDVEPSPTLSGCISTNSWAIPADHVTEKLHAPVKVVKPPTKFELVHIVERIELFCVGLCLDCLKGSDKCRVPHSDPFGKNLWIPLRHMGHDGVSDFGADTERPASWESCW